MFFICRNPYQNVGLIFQALKPPSHLPRKVKILIEGPFTPSASINAVMMLAILFSLKQQNCFKIGCNLFWSDSIVSNESSIASVVAALTLTFGIMNYT